MNDELIRCGCFDHAIGVAWDEDTLYLSLYEQVKVRDYGRFRRAWAALRGVANEGNEAVLRRDEALHLRDLIDRFAEAAS